jgi:hypothetical protein
VRGIGALLAIYGFLSAVLYFFEYHISILAWADKWQPAFGLIVGCAGMVFLGISLWTHKEEPAEPQPGGPYATPGGPPMAPPMAGPGPGPVPNRVPQQGPQFGPRPPQGPPPQGRPPQPQYPPPRPPNQLPPGGPTGFGPQGGPPYGSRG